MRGRGFVLKSGQALAAHRAQRMRYSSSLNRRPPPSPPPPPADGLLPQTASSHRLSPPTPSFQRQLPQPLPTDGIFLQTTSHRHHYKLVASAYCLLKQPCAHHILLLMYQRVTGAFDASLLQPVMGVAVPPTSTVCHIITSSPHDSKLHHLLTSTFNRTESFLTNVFFSMAYETWIEGSGSLSNIVQPAQLCSTASTAIFLIALPLTPADPPDNPKDPRGRGGVPPRRRYSASACKQWRGDALKRSNFQMKKKLSQSLDNRGVRFPLRQHFP
ncbi:hypothetical protein FHG87_013116 [Trinorchestia longiramus]|nr:hypothetical protein FHG87_013116 [Trinorchestia longiramus]